MSITSFIFRLAKKLPAKPAVIFCQFIVFGYLMIRKIYRDEIKINYQKIFNDYQKGFWVKQSQRIGRNLGLMLQIGKNNKSLDKTVIYGENIMCKVMGSNQNAIVVSFHYGLWEYLPQIFQKLGFETHIGIGIQPDKNLAIEFDNLRKNNGVKILNTVSQMKNCLKQSTGQTSSLRKKLLGFVLDNTSKTQGLMLDKPWSGFSVLRTPFVLTKSTGVPILSMFCYGQDDRIIVDIQEVKSRVELGNQLHYYIRKNPAEWLFWGKNDSKN
jgi:lauroyl/myristoyl acyltransferase